MPGWELIRRAHELGLAVHPFTFRDDAKHLDVRWQGSPGAEIRHFMGLGIDAAFTDFPGTWTETLSSPQVRACTVCSLRQPAAASLLGDSAT